MNWIEIVAVIFTLISTYLAVKRHVWTWWTGIIGVVAYAVVFLQTHALANVALQVLYFGQSVWGWYYWQMTQENRLIHPKWKDSKVPFWVYVGVMVFLTLTIYYAEITWLNVPEDIALFDANSTALSIVAIILLVREVLYNWLFWIVANVTYVILFLKTDSPMSAILYGIMFVLAVRGLIEWLKLLKESEGKLETV